MNICNKIKKILITLSSGKYKENHHVIFMMSGLIPFSFYAMYHFFWDVFHVGVISLTNAVIIGLVLRETLNERVRSWHNDFLLFAMISSVVYICYFLGIRGIVFIFPVIIGVFFNYPRNLAVRLSSVFSIVALLASLNVVATDVAVRTSIPIVITIALSLLYARKIESHKAALKHEANSDYLTGIFNRRSFMTWLTDNINQEKYNKLPTVYFIDIDNFKRVNDTYGHAAGDKLLLKISQRLVDATRFTDPILSQLNNKAARIAGDEFVVAISGVDNDIHINMIAQRLLKAINKEIIIDNIKFNVHASIGVAIATSYMDKPEDLIHHADLAMFEAKKQGKNRVGYFSQDLADEIQRKNNIASAIKSALELKKFTLQFMPIYNQSLTYIVGAESLIRNNDVLKDYHPEQYIKIAEEFDLITEIDLFVIEHSFQYLQSILHTLEKDEFILAINISALELKNIHFPEQVTRLAEKYNIDSTFIEFEITETTLVDHDERAISLLHKLKALGYKLSLDDFGTGYTAFSQLQNYPVDTLKIDKSFIATLSENKNDKNSMVEVVLSLAKLYQLNVIAEGVEQQYQLDYLQELGCQFYQGYYLSKPISWQQLTAQLKQQKIDLIPSFK